MSLERGTCRQGCRATIFWVRTVAGHAMPLDPAATTAWVTTAKPTGPDRRRINLMTADGVMQTGYAAEAGQPFARAITGYVPHWATCPKRAQFKRPA